MNILIVSGSFFPLNFPRSHRTTELAKELARQGHTITVIFPDIEYNYSEWQEKYPTLHISPTKALKWRKKIDRKKQNKFAHIYTRLLTLFFEYPSIEWYLKMPAILKNEKNYDLLISIAVPHPIHWGISRCYKNNTCIAKTWVADCGDPYMGATIEKIKKPFYFKYFEKLFCKWADYITVPTEGAIEAYYPEFRKKIRVIPQGFNMDNIKLYKGEIENSNIITLGYAGGLSKGVRDPSLLLNYLIESNKSFEFVIYTKQKDFLSKYTNILNEKLEIHDYVEREELIYELSKVDFLINFDNGTNRQTPSKLIDYAIIGKPVLNINCQQINTKTIDEFFNRNYIHSFPIPDKENYNITRIAKQFIELIDEK